MQKIQFNTYSDSQLTISPPSLKRFINDFNYAAKDLGQDVPIINFKAVWTFKRDNPTGKEKTEGRKEIALTKKDMLPIITMLEQDQAKRKMNVKKQLTLAQSSMLEPSEDEYC